LNQGISRLRTIEENFIQSGASLFFFQNPKANFQNPKSEATKIRTSTPGPKCGVGGYNANNSPNNATKLSNKMAKVTHAVALFRKLQFNPHLFIRLESMLMVAWFSMEIVFLLTFNPQ